jgi:hypothetical protein
LRFYPRNVSVKLTKGFGGPQGVRILIMICVVGMGVVPLAYAVRYRVLAPKGVVAVEMPREQVLAHGEKAQGPMVELGYRSGDMARVATFAAACLSDGKWDGSGGRHDLGGE